MIKYLIFLAILFGWSKLPDKRVHPKKELKFAKDFQMPNEKLDYSEYD